MAFNAFDNFVEIQKLKEELRAKSGNLVVYPISHVAETDGQRQFAINLSTFNPVTDNVFVVSGRTFMSSTLDYVVQSHSIVLNEGVPKGRTLDIYVFKNVENLDTEKTIDGLQIAKGSIPLDRLNGSVGGKLHMYDACQEATVDGQTEFDIPIVSFDETEDALWVFEGYLMLHKGLDYTLKNGKVVLTEGVHEGCTISMYVFKQVEQTNQEKLISGLMIEPGTLPLDRLAEEIPTPTAESLGAVKEEDLPETIQSLLTGGEISMIKSIQRGVASCTDNETTNVSINTVNPDKTVVHYETIGGRTTFSPAILSELSANTVKFEIADISNLSASLKVSYQVIEYY